MLLYILHLISYTKFTYDEKDEMLFLFNQVRNVASKDKKLLEIELSILGMISSLSNKNEKKKLLAEIINRCPNNTNNQQLKFIKFKALCNLSTIVDTSNEIIKLITIAEKILEKIKDESLERELLKAKASVISEINDDKMEIKWGKELFNQINSKATTDLKPLHVDIASNLISLNDANLNTICISKNNLKSIIVKILDDYMVDTTSCKDMLDFVRCCQFVYRTTDSEQEKYEFTNKVYLLKDSFPHECPSYSYYLEMAVLNMVVLPSIIVTDDIKCSILETLKDDSKTNKIFYRLLPVAIESDDIDITDKFREDVSIYKDELELKRKAFKLYVAKEISEAEKIYNDLCKSLFTYISDAAKTNLSFIIRRNENIGYYQFWDIIKSKHMMNEFDWMNIALYCLSNNDTANPEYNKAINHLDKLTNEEIENLKSCWADISLVGEEESTLALSLIDHTQTK